MQMISRPDLKNLIKSITVIALSLIITSCGSSKPSRYKLRHDSHPHPKQLPNSLYKLKPIIPKKEPKSKIGNPKSYVIKKRRYRVLSSAKNYKATGIASWYGKRFHGYRTSNGEIYDMFKLTAAHKSLPLPTYVKVHNLENNRTIIVRVNDRGPFHKNRIMDLSYAAAYQLGILKKGTAKVRITAITSFKSKKSNNKKKNYYFYKDKIKTKSAAQKEAALINMTGNYGTAKVLKHQKYWKVVVGPISYKKLNKAKSELTKKNFKTKK